MSIRKSMQITICLMVLIPFLVFSLLIVHICSEQMERMAEDSLQAVANAQITEMTNFCRQQMRDLVVLGDTEVFRSALAGERDAQTLKSVTSLLRSRVANTDYIEVVALVDMDDRVVACSDETFDLYTEPGFYALADRTEDAGFHITNVVTDAKERQGVVAISRIADGAQSIGYVVAEISLDFYNSIRENSLLWNDATFYLLDGNGTIISAGTAEDQRDNFITTKAERADYAAKVNAIDFEKEPRGSFSYDIGGKSYITHYSDIDYTRWRIMLTVGLDGYTAWQVIYTVLFVFLALLCLISAVWVAWITTAHVIRPLDGISDVLQQIREKQDYSLRLPPNRTEEMGRLSAEVNELINSVEMENLDVARRQSALQRKAERDALTKMMNKERIEQYLSEALLRCRESSRPLAVLFADVDDFKSFNSRYGHSVGDQVLKFFAAACARQTRGAVGRVGGDEFLIVMDELTDPAALETCLKALKAHIENDFVLRGGGPVPVYCCFGVLWVDCAPDMRPITPAELIDRADELMYQAKNHGKKGYRIERLDETGEQ